VRVRSCAIPWPSRTYADASEPRMTTADRGMSIACRVPFGKTPLFHTYRRATGSKKASRSYQKAVACRVGGRNNLRDCARKARGIAPSIATCAFIPCGSRRWSTHPPRLRVAEHRPGPPGAKARPARPSFPDRPCAPSLRRRREQAAAYSPAWCVRRFPGLCRAGLWRAPPQVLRKDASARGNFSISCGLTLFSACSCL